MGLKRSRTANYYISNGLLCVIGYVVNKSIAFFMIPVLTRIMPAADYGKVNTYVAWLSILVYFMGLALEYSIRNAYVDYKTDFEGYISSVCGLSIINLVIMGLGIFILNKFIFRQGSDIICIFCILHAYVHAVINYFNIKYTMLQQYKKRVLLLIIPNLLSSLLSVLLIINFDNEKYMGRILGYVLVFIPLGIMMLILQRSRGTFYNRRFWKYGLTISLPMIIHGLSSVILTNSDRIILGKISGDEVTGIYSLVYNCSMVVIAITGAIENIWIPWFTEKMSQSRYEAINKTASSYISLVFIIIAGILLVSPEVINIMSPEEYSGGKVILVPLIVSSFIIFLYSLSVGVEVYYKATRYIAWNTLFAAVINIILDIILIPFYGMKAAAYVTLFSYICSFLIHYICGKRLNSKLFPFRIYVGPIVFITVVSAVCKVMQDQWILRWAAAIVMAVVYLVSNLRRRNKENHVYK